MKKPKKILICPLDWGLGHATRMVPIIDNLVDRGESVVIGADNGAREFLLIKYPSLKHIRLPGFSPTYPKGRSMAMSMAIQYPKMIKMAKKANLLLQEIIHEYKIDIIISDNRYELSSSKVYNILLSHQLNIITRGLQSLFKPFINSTISNYIKNFDELWVPDTLMEPGLSSDLSHGISLSDNQYYIGPLSRFYNRKTTVKVEDIDVLCIMSGPEPQRTILEDILIEQLRDKQLRVVILRGKPNENEIIQNNNIKIISHINDVEFAELIENSRLIISRSGYSTIMDLVVFGKSALFVPTPGQTEQEFLADKFKKQSVFNYQEQQNINIEKAIEQQNTFTGIKLTNDFVLLNKRLDNILNGLFA